MAALLNHGKTNTTENVLSHLHIKHPQIIQAIVQPGPYPGCSELRENDRVFNVDHNLYPNVNGRMKSDRSNERTSDPTSTHSNVSETKTV